MSREVFVRMGTLIHSSHRGTKSDVLVVVNPGDEKSKSLDVTGPFRQGKPNKFNGIGTHPDSAVTDIVGEIKIDEVIEGLRRGLFRGVEIPAESLERFTQYANIQNRKIIIP
jgi:hypothetical protein